MCSACFLPHEPSVLLWIQKPPLDENRRKICENVFRTYGKQCE